MVRLSINIKKSYIFIILLIGVIGFTLAFGGTNPPEVGHSSGEVEVTSGGVQKTLQEAINDGDFGGGGGGGPSQTFVVANPDQSTFTCIEQDMQSLCGNADGCFMRMLPSYEPTAQTYTGTFGGHIYFEQSVDGAGNGWAGHTIDESGTGLHWVTGAGPVNTILEYNHVNPGGFSGIAAGVYNYRPFYCPDSGPEGVAHSDPYTLTFVSNPEFNTVFQIYD